MSQTQTQLHNLLQKYLPQHLLDCAAYNDILAKYAAELDATPIQQSKYYYSPSYYAPPPLVGETDISANNRDSDIAEFVLETLNLLEHIRVEETRERIRTLPETLREHNPVYCASEEDATVAHLRGELVFNCPIRDEFQLVLAIAEDELFYNNTKIMSSANWDKFHDEIIDTETCTMFNEVSSHIFNTAANIMNAVMRELQASVVEKV